MPQVIDCFMINNELSMLECRLHELADEVDRFVLVEAAVTHRGVPKPLHYADNKERFAPWADQIVHVVADLPDNPDPWVREHAQRDAAMTVLDDLAKDDDIILISDVDEFPPPESPFPDPVISHVQRLCMYAVDWEYPELHLCSVAARWGHVRRHGLARVRDGRYTGPAVVGGFHLTWLGGVEAQRAKLATICHTEMTPEQAEIISSGRAYYKGEHQSGECMMIPVDVDETWPRWIYERKCPADWFRPR